MIIYLFIVAAVAIWAIRNARLLTRIGKLAMNGECHQCGYDLRASGDTCPECGSQRLNWRA